MYKVKLTQFQPGSQPTPSSTISEMAGSDRLFGIQSTNPDRSDSMTICSSLKFTGSIFW